MSVEIPNEAYDAGAKSVEGWPIASGDRYDLASEVIQAAAPHIARAAQVEILNEMEAQLRDSYEESKILAYFEAAEQLRTKRVRIERGGNNEHGRGD